jgi:hypothetical protein
MPNQVAIEAGKKWFQAQTEAFRKKVGAPDDEAFEVFGNSVLMHEDYTRKTQEAAEQKRQADEALEANKTKRAELEEWYKKTSAGYEGDKSELTRLKAFEQEALGKFELLANKYRVPAEEIKLEMASGNKSAEDAAAAVADQGGKAAVKGGGVSPDDLNQTADSLVTFQGEMLDLMADHQELFGNKLRAKDLISEAAKAGTGDIRQFWEEKYGVAAKREEVAEAEKKEWEEKIRKEAKDEALRELGGMPGPGSKPGKVRGSTVLATLNEQNAERDKDKKPGEIGQSDASRHGALVQRAIESYRELGSED